MGHDDVAIDVGFPRAWRSGRDRTRSCVQRVRAGCLSPRSFGSNPSKAGAGLPSKASTRMRFHIVFPTSLPKEQDLPHDASTRMRFHTVFPISFPKERDLPHSASTRMRFHDALSTDSQEGLDRPKNGSGRGAPPRRTSSRFPEGARPSAQRVRGECPSPLPFGPIPFRRRRRRRKTSRLPYPWRLRESETSSLPRLLK
jgi:hypothetical protein